MLTPLTSFRSRALTLGACLASAACAPDVIDEDSPGDEASSSSLQACFATKQAADGKYRMTAFGCSDASRDRQDNCLPSCLPKARQSNGICEGMSGRQCEENTAYYTADAGRFGCLTRLRITNHKAKKSVVAAVLDHGPSCAVEASSTGKPVLDASSPVNRYLFGSDKGKYDNAMVEVEVLDDLLESAELAKIKLGPVPYVER